jgi:hypothetical protein
VVTARLKGVWAWSLAAAAVGLCVLASARAAGVVPPPGVRPNAAWIAQTSGPQDPAQKLPQLFIVTAKPARPRPRLPLSIFDGLRRLAPNGALIWAMTVSRGHYDRFPSRSWPPRLALFRLDHAWEGQPLPRIQQRLLWFTANGWSFDVRVYFGTQQPPRALVRAVQAELDRLTLPRA